MMQTKKEYIDYVTKFVQRLGDIRFAGQVLFVIIVLMISWSGIKTIQSNYGLQKQITSIDQQNQLQKLQNDNLSLQNQYYNSKQYLELSARQNFGLAAPGETEIIVSKDVALAHTVDLPNPDEQAKVTIKQPAYQRNLQAWTNFFLHRQNTGN